MGDERRAATEAGLRDAFPGALVTVTRGPAEAWSNGAEVFRAHIRQGGRDAHAVWCGDVPKVHMRATVAAVRRILTVPDGPASLGGRQPGDVRWAVDLGDAVHEADGSHVAGRMVHLVDRARRFVKLDDGTRLAESELHWQNGKLCRKAVSDG